MTINLKTTILASSALAGLLNVAQFAFSYNQQARAAFAPGWADAASVHPSPTPAAVQTAAVVATPAPTIVSDAPVAPATVDPAAAIGTKLSAAGLNPSYAGLYLNVQTQTGTPWQLLAAVHHFETGQSGTTSRTSYAGATGPMQFMPATFAHYAMDGDGNGIKDIHNLDDAMLTAGRYLASDGAAKGQYSNALYGYNHSSSYVSKVLSLADRLGL